MRFYFDEHMPRAVADELIKRKHAVIMAVDIGMMGADDDEGHLKKSTELNAVLVTRDLPFAGRASQRNDHSGLICWTGAQNDFGGMIRNLDKFASGHEQSTVQGQVFWLK